MAHIPVDQPVVPSVLDRLILDDPSSTRDPDKSWGVVLRELRESVRRDLENFLNTRQRCRSWPAALGELNRSLINYGVPDFTGAGLGSDESRSRFRRSLEVLIRSFEPRFKTVRVTVLENANPADRTLRLRIDALLHAEPAPEPLSFDTTVEPVSRTFEVRGADDV